MLNPRLDLFQAQDFGALSKQDSNSSVMKKIQVSKTHKI